MKIFKRKKDSPVTKNEKEIKRLERRFKKVITKLGIEFKITQGLWTGEYACFENDSPIVILQEKVDLILKHLGLEYKSTEERTQGMKGKLYKKPEKGKK